MRFLEHPPRQSARRRRAVEKARARSRGCGRGVAMKPFKGRREDDRLLTGQGRYTADWNFPGQLYGYFLRSDRAHAEIVSIDTEEAKKSPGVLAVFTGKDTEHF